MKPAYDLDGQMLQMRQLESSDLEALRHFTDREIGAGYYSPDELERIYHRSQRDGVMCSLVLESPKDGIMGVRITYPPGQWQSGKGRGLNPEKWPHALSKTAYFQSLFLASGLQGAGWGGRLSGQALKILRELGASGVVCHSWKESPNDSSTRYLRKLGFELIAEHLFYWKDIDYECTRCGRPPCLCTALEMYLNLEAIT